MMSRKDNLDNRDYLIPHKMDWKTEWDADGVSCVVAAAEVPAVAAAAVTGAAVASVAWAQH